MSVESSFVRRFVVALAVCSLGGVGLFLPDTHAAPVANGLRERFERLRVDPLLEPWQRDFFRRRLEMLNLGSAPASDRAVLAAPDTSLPPGGEAIWSVFVPAPQHAGHAAVYDSIADRILIVGGESVSGLTSDVWALSLRAPRVWAPLRAGPPLPSPRMGHAVVLDAQHHRLLMFGGQDADGSYLDDLWAFPLDGPSQWQRIVVDGERPGARTNHSAVYDAVAHRMIVFGGTDGSFQPLDETWVLSLDDTLRWTRLTAPGAPPTGRSGHIAIVDPVRNRMLVCAGSIGSGYEYGANVWALSLGSSPVWTVDGPFYSDAPTGIGFHGIYDPVNNGMLAFSAYDYNIVHSFRLSGSPSWTSVSTPTKPFDIGYAFALVLDPRLGRAVVVGGHTSSSTEYRSDAWGLALSGYTDWQALFRLPYPRSGQAAAYDPARERMWVFGGSTSSYSYSLTNELWSLSLGEPPQWSLITPLGTAPDPRQGATMIYDPVRDRMVLFGGNNSSQSTNEVWELALSVTPTWTRLHPTGFLPHQRSGHGAAYDPGGNRMIVFGGGEGYSQLADVWALSLIGSPAWEKLIPLATAPGPRTGQAMVYDAARLRMLIVGGNSTSYPSDAAPGDVWALSLGPFPAWSKLPSTPLTYDVAGDCQAILDPLNHRVLRFGRSNYYGSYNLQLHSYSLDGDSLWRTLGSSGDSPSAGLGASAVYDVANDRVLMYGGTAGGYGAMRPEVWALSLSAPPLSVPSDGPAARARVHLSAYPNPTRDRLQVRFGTPAPGSARLEVVDLAGRRVFERDLGRLPAGAHDLDLGSATRIAPGLYFLKCTWNGEITSARIAIMK